MIITIQTELSDGTPVEAEISEDGLESVYSGSRDITDSLSTEDRRAIREEGFRALDEETAKQELDALQSRCWN